MIVRVMRRLRREIEHRERAERLPERLALLLASPRSGSTWLFDAMRCHPAMMLKPEADVYSYLKLRGRRYPQDLRGNVENAVRVEVRPNKWEPLPRFALMSALTSPTRNLPPFFLEKLHPHFFQHDVDGFIGKLRQLEATTTIRMVYQVRDPRASLLSFLAYKARNPQWNRRISPDEVFPHMRRICDSIYRCATRYPGLIVDYQELEDSLESTLTRVFGFIWPDKRSVDPDMLAEIATVTDRARRGGTPFISDHINRPSDDPAETRELFKRHQNDVEACYESYRAVLNLRQNPS
ncbi:MAG: hypothetical protein H3C32_01960 [Anaerolineae bacterium]|nr:MAG: hypothetical protein UZ13_03668 [Chloroflexi bacterium OLB13]MBW7878051.1 hypothetical protein [Anaerolineae bacterium]